ncbi:PspA/IM30 family protein [Sphingomicrobium arenosum]|uniref:PspA/IM30 family protein n=1 Tax=Sphingomicrobium arenosum TaxID=2233861 RepID=UPI002241006F|nr:PspA/IM30 family protein [Sphingomicrobium arenosum]
MTAENFFQRARRVVASGIDSALGAAEKATGPALLGQAVRDIEQARANLVRAKAKAEHQAAIADAAAQADKDAAAGLGKDAAYALDKGRDDLARDAVERQMTLEAEAAAQALAATQARAHAAELAVSISEVEAELEQARSDVAAITAGRKPSGQGAGGTGKAARVVQRSRDLIDRMAAARPLVASIDALRREEELEARMAALKVGPANAKKATAKRK